MTESKFQVTPYEPLFWPRKYTLVHRIIFLAIMLYLTIEGTVNRGWRRYIFLTVQSEIMMVIYNIVAILHYLLDNDEDRTITKVKSVIMHISASFQFLVMIFYWLVLVPLDWLRIQNTFPEDSDKRFYHMVSFVQHAIYCIYIWFNIMTERTTFSNSNLKYLLTYALIYTLFNLGYTKYYGVPIYPPIDWKTPKSAVMMGASFLLAMAGFRLSTGLSNRISSAFGFKIKDILTSK